MQVATVKTPASLKSQAEDQSVKVQLSSSIVGISGLRQREMHAVPRPMKRLLCFLSIAAFFGLCITGYFAFFHRGPTSAILEQNREKEAGNAQVLTEDYEYFDSEGSDRALMSPAGSVRLWNAFIRKNKFVAIGDIHSHFGEYSNCS